MNKPRMKTWLALAIWIIKHKPSTLSIEEYIDYLKSHPASKNYPIDEVNTPEPEVEHLPEEDDKNNVDEVTKWRKRAMELQEEVEELRRKAVLMDEELESTKNALTSKYKRKPKPKDPSVGEKEDESNSPKKKYKPKAKPLPPSLANTIVSDVDCNEFIKLTQDISSSPDDSAFEEDEKRNFDLLSAMSFLHHLRTLNLARSQSSYADNTENRDAHANVIAHTLSRILECLRVRFLRVEGEYLDERQEKIHSKDICECIERVEGILKKIFDQQILTLLCSNSTNISSIKPPLASLFCALIETIHPLTNPFLTRLLSTTRDVTDLSNYKDPRQTAILLIINLLSSHEWATSELRTWLKDEITICVVKELERISMKKRQDEDKDEMEGVMRWDVEVLLGSMLEKIVLMAESDSAKDLENRLARAATLEALQVQLKKTLIGGKDYFHADIYTTYVWRICSILEKNRGRELAVLEELL